MSPTTLTHALRATLPAILATGLTAVADGPTTKSKWTTAVYLLQEAYKAPLGYRFTLYVSGPHAREPEMDLLSAKEHGLVLFDQNPGDHRYSILPGPKAQYAAVAITGVWSHYMAGMRSFIRSLGPLTSSELNLRATAHYMFHSNNPPPPPSMTSPPQSTNSNHRCSTETSGRRSSISRTWDSSNMTKPDGPERPYPYLTANEYQALAESFRTPLPDALPHRHHKAGELCTDRRCLAEASHHHYFCAVGEPAGETLCYDSLTNFRCSRASDERRHCSRKNPHTPIPEDTSPNDPHLPTRKSTPPHRR